ncbi:hypothetical protein [Massilia sp. ST3]|uniref:hypothetical protein n=1 Tax=Massilia sp. ST3 TaxID=2824903 RepID=UPI001B8D806E|nr:hypothetical protein [Massilia sp. ST3]
MRRLIQLRDSALEDAYAAANLARSGQPGPDASVSAGAGPARKQRRKRPATTKGFLL